MSAKPLLLVTGGAGYLGSNLIRDALAAGFRVRCLDILVYGGQAIVGLINHPDFELVTGDVRVREDVERAMEGADYVVHLAAIVGDVPCRVAPKSSYQINFTGTQMVADCAKARDVKRFVFASTCSNYGITESDALVSEDDRLNPVSLYAETKIDCERYLKEIATDDFIVVTYRFGTVYGISFRTRFDLLVNSFVYEAVTAGELLVFAAKMWRPYIHVRDISRIIMKSMTAAPDMIAGQIFNGGSTEQNYRKEDIVSKIQDQVPDLGVKYAGDIDDKRNYRVDFSRLETQLGFRPSITVDEGISELLFCLHNGILTEKDYKSNNLAGLEEFYARQESKLAE